MFKPKYPPSDTHNAIAPSTTPAPVVPTHQAPSGIVQKAATNPTAVIVGVVAVGAVLVSTLLAVAITGIALSISGVVLLLLVRLLRQEVNR
ncbi:SpdD protein [Streptomyces ficellus]|uniref:SpdD protein n=1 Tax=Streptomyces ficellus TaxID=1977088 RepID=A0ABT7Z4E7_9ACTN|nr:SpdD protein [Streptomyces ficellus]MDN3294369.1 SpdD protein [Streptomyces ficellus]